MHERMKSFVLRFVYFCCLTLHPDSNPLGFQFPSRRTAAFSLSISNPKKWSTTQTEIDSNTPSSNMIEEQGTNPLEVPDAFAYSKEQNLSSPLTLSENAVEKEQPWWEDTPSETAKMSPSSSDINDTQGFDNLNLSESPAENSNDTPPLAIEETPYSPPTNQDIVGSEWKVGIMWKDTNQIQETWIRCKDDFRCEWENGQGSWEVDGKVISFTRDYVAGWNGKRIFSAPLRNRNNEVYLEGLIRGWGPFTPAEVMGQFQAIRLGIDRTSYDEPSWMSREDDAELDYEISSTMPEEPFWESIIDATKKILNPGDDDAGS